MHSEKHQLLIAEGKDHDILAENPGIVLNGIIELVIPIKSPRS